MVTSRITRKVAIIVETATMARRRRGLIRRGGPRHGPPHPPTFGAPRETRGAPRSHASCMGPRHGPPHPPTFGAPPETPGAPPSHPSCLGPPPRPPPPPPPPHPPAN